MFENKGSNILLVGNPTRSWREVGDQQGFSHANKAQTKFQDRWNRISPTNVLWSPQISGQTWASTSLCWKWQHKFQTFRKERWRSRNKSIDTKSAGFQGDKYQKRNSSCSKAFPQLWVVISNAVLDNCLPVKCYTSKRETDPSLLLGQSNVKSSKTSAPLSSTTEDYKMGPTLLVKDRSIAWLNSLWILGPFSTGLFSNKGKADDFLKTLCNWARELQR